MEANVTSIAREKIEDIPVPTRAKMLAQIEALERGMTEGLILRTLRGPIKEIKVKQYRVIYFVKRGVIYVVDVFTKKSQKTPVRRIDAAEGIYRAL